MPRTSLFGNVDITRQRNNQERNIVPIPEQGQEEEQGFLSKAAGAVGNFAKELAHTPARAVVTAYAPAAATSEVISEKVFGRKGGVERADKILNEGVNVPVFGQLKPYKIGTDVGEGDGPFGENTKETLGAGAELASWYGGGKGMNLLREGVKGAGLKKLAPLAFAEAKLGAATGLAGMAGSEAQREGSTASDIAGAGIMGLAFGGPLGFASPYASRGLSRLGKGIKDLNKQSDELFNNAKALKAAETIKPVAPDTVPQGPTTPFTDTVTPVPASGPTSPMQIADMSDELAELVPPKAPDAVPLDEKTIKKAQKAGFTDFQTTLFGEMSGKERALSNQMLDLAEAKVSAGGSLGKMPDRVIAETMVSPVVDGLRSVKQATGASLDTVIDEMPNKPIPLSEPIKAFDNWLGEKGISIVTDGKGRPVDLDFSASQFRAKESKSDQEAIRTLFTELFPPQAKGQVISRTPKEIRTMRQVLRNVGEANKQSNAPFSTQIDRLIAGVREELNKPLSDPNLVGEMGPVYAKNNREYAIATSALEDFYRYLGQDYYDKTGSEIAGRSNEILYRMISNVGEKPREKFGNLYKAAKEVGLQVPELTDPTRLLNFANEVNRAYGLINPRSAQGIVKSGVESGIEAVGTGMDVAGAAHGSMGSVMNLASKIFRTDQVKARRAILREMVKNRGGQEVMGAVAGIQPEFDEEGNPIGVTYDPALGALGLGAGVAAKKVAKEAGEQMLKKVVVPRISKEVSKGLKKSMSELPDVAKIDLLETIDDLVFEGTSTMPAKDLGKFINGNVIEFKIDPKKLQSIFSNERTTSENVVNKYAEAMRRGDIFPPVIVADGRFLDGGHRVKAAINAGIKEINAIDVTNIVNDAIKFGKDEGYKIVKNIEDIGDIINQKDSVGMVADEVFEGFTDLSLKTLEKLKGKTTVSRQFIEDLAKAPDLKQAERDVISSVLEEMTGTPKIPEYGMSHRPSFEGMPPAYNLLEGDALPRDVYSNPEYSIASGRDLKTDKASKESWKALQEIKDNPNAEVTVYRASPKNELNPGDWVSFSKTYAKGEGVAEGSKVYPFKVKAQDVIFAGDDINEFGYYPKANDKINVQEFADKVKAELLPLKRIERDPSMIGSGRRYENISLDESIRGPIEKYSEHVYESPVSTSAGNVHFPESKNYFGHTRVEDVANASEGTLFRTSDGELVRATGFTKNIKGVMGGRKGASGMSVIRVSDGKPLGLMKVSSLTPVDGGNTRRVIEVQSDLFQRGRLEEELVKFPEIYRDWEYGELTDKIKTLTKDNSDPDVLKELNSIKRGFDFEIERYKARNKLSQYSNPTAHFRMIREEVKRAAQDGKTKLQFPTGETAMKIEGLGVSNGNWYIAQPDPSNLYQGRSLEGLRPGEPLNQEMLEVGKTVISPQGSEPWIITDVLGDGKFKAVPKRVVDQFLDSKTFGGATDFQTLKDELLQGQRYPTDRTNASIWEGLNNQIEEFDISGTVDKDNPIYKFYDKEVQKYLKNKYGAKQVTDPQGVTWFEVDIKPDMAKAPVEAFAAVPIGAGMVLKEKEANKKDNKR